MKGTTASGGCITGTSGNQHEELTNTIVKVAEDMDELYRKITPLQLDSSKCGFGHFYYAMIPPIPEVRPIWDALGEKHKKFH